MAFNDRRRNPFEADKGTPHSLYVREATLARYNLYRAVAAF
jgi:hypothetical protein